MATYTGTVRRGLPRRPGGDPWPPAGEAAVVAEPVVEVVAPAVASVAAAPGAAQAEAAGPTAAKAPKVTADAPAAAAPGAAQAEAAGPVGAESPKVTAGAGAARTIRRGLPRVPGGEPWPPAGLAPVAAVTTAATGAAGPTPGAAGPTPAPDAAGPAATTTTPAPDAAASAAVTTPAPDAAASAAVTTPAPDAAASVAAPTAASASPVGGTEVSDKPLRRGLPRVAGGEPWPPAGFAPALVVARPDTTAAPAPVAELVVAETVPAASVGATLPDQAPSQAQVAAAVATLPAESTDLSVPLPFTRTVWPGTGGRAKPAPAAEPQLVGPFTRLQWAGAVIVGGVGLLLAAAMAVVLVRWLLSLEPLQDFLTTYPGEYHLPEGAPVGFPAWLGWQHFFNVFLIVLIIRSGLRVRSEKRPTAFWSPRWNSKRKISLTLWFHQSLDILWLVNGVIFVILLFVSGQWMRIVPTSWEVFPNAISAALQYVSLDWPTENGWVNYNSLQQLAYFTTVFIAAPLAVITGVRMSGIWPANAKTLNRIYPVEWARALHFPVMLYFVAFITVHVALVFATGALRNLNHMYAAQGSVDGVAYADNWAGFWIFIASIVVIAAAWIAARPLVLAPIARLFGKVSGR
ncbi:cytochrome b/b6 domain-containing protein [Microbacterium terregens]|uniref:cytochrome b/b6 domain-containing protein n=1 Tax=Microbacterium terregens TaxID=69363 RepID=UPI0031E3FA0B